MASQTGSAKAPDNNKRLKLLEAGVSTLAMSLVSNGIPVADGADPITLAIGAIKERAELEENNAKGSAAHKETLEQLSASGKRVEQLEQQLESIKGHVAPLADYLIANHPGAIVVGGGACETAVKVLAEQATQIEALTAGSGGTTAEDATAGLEDRIDELERQIIAKDSRIADLEAGAPVVVQAAAEADSAAEEEPAPRERPETARDVGPDYAGLHSSADIAALVASGEAHGLELAFSNGEFEIVALQPVPIEAKDLQLFEGRSVVAPSIHAKLGVHDAAEELHGFGLMLQGEQIGYCPLLDPLRLQPGTERRFDRAIYF
jgi:hypothetical protein